MVWITYSFSCCWINIGFAPKCLSVHLVCQLREESNVNRQQKNKQTFEDSKSFFFCSKNCFGLMNFVGIQFHELHGVFLCVYALRHWISKDVLRLYAAICLKTLFISVRLETLSISIRLKTSSISMHLKTPSISKCLKTPSISIGTATEI